MTSKDAPLVTTGGKERIEATSKLYTEAFADDPVLSYMLSRYTDAERHRQLYTYFKRLLTAAGLNAGIFEEVDGFAAATVIMPPGEAIDNPWTMIPAGLFGLLFQVGVRGCYRMLVEFDHVVEAAKKKGLGVKRYKQGQYFYLFFIATRPNCQGRGLGSITLKAVKQRAAESGKPVWLEATTERSRDLYARHGFELVEKMTLGKGHAGPDGKQREGGEGVHLWAMIWTPPAKT